MNNKNDPPPISPALRPLFNVIGTILVCLGFMGIYTAFQASSFVVIGGSLACLGLGAELMRAGITGRKLGAWDGWFP